MKFRLRRQPPEERVQKGLQPPEERVQNKVRKNWKTEKPENKENFHTIGRKIMFMGLW